MDNIVLNKNQNIAVNHQKGPMMVLSGPGSGKTTVITYRLKNLVINYMINPKDITIITFTKASSIEMKNKFNKICPNINGINFGTFHSFFFKIIRDYYGYNLENVLQEEEKREIIKQIILKKGIFISEEEELLQNILTEISLIKNELIEIDYYNSTFIGSEDFISIFKEYEQIKGKNNKIDFDDMLALCYELLKNNEKVLMKWQKICVHILIDEFQDINRVQYECIKLLANPENNLFIVGDDDQSIYKFRGARPEFLLKFPTDFENSQKIILDINYRSTDEIISLSNYIIADNKHRYEKEIKGASGKGKKPMIMKSKDISSEAFNIGKQILKMSKDTPMDSMAVIYRTNMQGRAFVDAFMDLKIPFQIKDNFPSIYDHWINKDISAYLKLSQDKSLSAEAERIINKPSRYISKSVIKQAKSIDNSLLSGLYHEGILENWQLKPIEELMFYLDAIKKRNTYDAIKYIRFGVGYDEYIKDYAAYKKIKADGLFEILNELQESAKNHEKIVHYLDFSNEMSLNAKKKVKKEQMSGVTLTTMHSAKGLEFDTVFVAGCVEGILPHEKSRSESLIEEERRLFYVAITRAIQNLYISFVENRYEKEMELSRFLKAYV